MNTNIRNSSKYAIRFDRLHAGSLFTIRSEPSRGIRKSDDARVYRKAQEHEGFFAYVDGDKTTCAVLMPFDLVQPIRKESPVRKEK